jgi:hypothetical protein
MILYHAWDMGSHLSGLWVCVYKRTQGMGGIAIQLVLSSLWIHQTTFQKGSQRNGESGHHCEKRKIKPKRKCINRKCMQSTDIGSIRTCIEDTCCLLASATTRQYTQSIELELLVYTSCIRLKPKPPIVMY